MHGYPLPPYLTPLFPIPAHFCEHFKHTHFITNSSIWSPWGSHSDFLFFLSSLALAGGALLLWCLVTFECELTFDWSSVGVLGTWGGGSYFQYFQGGFVFALQGALGANTWDHCQNETRTRTTTGWWPQILKEHWLFLHLELSHGGEFSCVPLTEGGFPSKPLIVALEDATFCGDLVPNPTCMCFAHSPPSRWNSIVCISGVSKYLHFLPDGLAALILAPPSFFSFSSEVSLFYSYVHYPPRVSRWFLMA